jgi:hypothetical protein
MSDITRNARVIHRNPLRSYGAGTVANAGANFAEVKFDGESAPRTVRTKDLIVIVTPAPLPGSRETARFCWPPERAGEPVMPGAA